MPLAKLDHTLPEAEQIAVPAHQRPIEPTGLVILAVGVVIALLGAAHLVTGGEHGDAAREQQQDREVAHLPVAERLDRRIAGFALDAAVPA